MSESLTHRVKCAFQINFELFNTAQLGAKGSGVLKICRVKNRLIVRAKTPLVFYYAFPAINDETWSKVKLAP